MAPLKQELPVRAALVIVALVLVASVVSGRERQDDVQPPPAATTEPVAHADGGGLKLARALEPMTVEPAQPGGFLPATTVMEKGADEPAPEPRTASPRREPRRPAPPLPFTYLGQMVDEGRTTVFVAKGDDHYGLQPGLVIDDAYKVERITDTQVTFVYVPLGVRQVLAVPSLKSTD